MAIEILGEGEGVMCIKLRNIRYFCLDFFKIQHVIL